MLKTLFVWKSILTAKSNLYRNVGVALGVMGCAYGYVKYKENEEFNIKFCEGKITQIPCNKYKALKTKHNIDYENIFEFKQSDDSILKLKYDSCYSSSQKAILRQKTSILSDNCKLVEEYCSDAKLKSKIIYNNGKQNIIYAKQYGKDMILGQGTQTCYIPCKVEDEKGNKKNAIATVRVSKNSKRTPYSVSDIGYDLVNSMIDKHRVEYCYVTEIVDAINSDETYQEAKINYSSQSNNTMNGETIKVGQKVVSKEPFIDSDKYEEQGLYVMKTKYNV